MSKDSRWIPYLLGRVALHALIGGLAAALVGAICVGVTGALTGAAMEGGTLISMSELPLAGLLFGLATGAASSGIAGAVLFGILGFLSAPRRSLLPPRALIQAAWLGQLLGALGICSSFFIFEALFALATRQGLRRTVSDHMPFIFFASPSLTLIGLVLGAVFAFRRAQSDTAQEHPLDPTAFSLPQL